MHSVSIRLYRTVCTLPLLSILLIYLPRFEVIKFSKGVAAARTWRYFEALMPVWGLWAYALFLYAVLIVSLIGMLRFLNWSRWLLTGALIGAICIRPFLGLSVHSAYDGFVNGIGGAAIIWLVTISFWSPLADRFSQRQS